MPGQNASELISLPQGGGALHGIGEKFAPDLFTGTGNFTIPLSVPAGRNGFQPALSLVYSTGNGNGPFGLGWSLSIPGVSRKTSQGIPIYDNAKDTFLLSGVEDLVQIERETKATNTEVTTRSRYRPRTEGLFARIDHYHGVDPKSHTILSDYWEVKSKDGLVSLYGHPHPAKTPHGYQDTATLADPAAPEHIFAWKLIRTTDPFGNRIDYFYDKDSISVDGPHIWDQNYLAEIRYIDYGDPAHPQFLATIRITYERRPDPFSDYRAGFEIRTMQRCTKIEVLTAAPAETHVRTYHLTYLPPEQLPLNGMSLLSQVQVEGRDGTVSEWLPPLEFHYSRFEPEKRRFSPVTGQSLPSDSLANPAYELVDLTGNGLPDVLMMNGSVRFWRNRGQGGFDLPRDMKTAPAGVSLADSGVQLLDANGDGSLDLLVTRGSFSGYYPLRFNGGWDQKSFQRYAQAPSFNLKDPQVHLLDLDGDGITDAIRSGSRMECFFNDPHKGWLPQNTRQVARKDLEVFPDITFSDLRVKWADMTGDGLQDIVMVYSGHIEYWPNLGYGNWGKRVSMLNCPRLPNGYDPQRILLGDVDGDGLADLVYVDNMHVTLWINQGGNRWHDPLTIEGTLPVNSSVAIRLVDLLGNGVGGLLYSAPANGLGRPQMYFLDFTGGRKPYLLNEMDNQMGALTRVEYAPSTRFYLEDEKRPEMRWKTPLPFPVQVVSRVEVIDALSQGKLTTEYRYHHGYWDGAEREFRGFGRVDQRNSEIFTQYQCARLHPDRTFAPVSPEFFSPPTETRTWFHQGPIGDEFGGWSESDYSQEYWSGDQEELARPQAQQDLLNALDRRVKRDALRALRGHILRSELYALDGTSRQNRPYTVTEYLYGLREESPPGPGGAPGHRHIFFPYALAGRTTQWERGDDPLTTFTFSGDYDVYGQVLSQCSIAVPRGRDFLVGLASPPAESYLVTLAETTYAQRDDDQRYIVNRVACTTTYEIVNDGTPALFDLWAAIQARGATMQVIGQTLNYYDGGLTQPLHGAFVGLPFGQLGDYGALVRSESLVLTREILQEAYKSGNTVTTPPEEPPYLVPGGTTAWTAEYPQEFRDLLPPLAGYTYQSGGPGSEYASGYFVASERRRYDFHADSHLRGRGLILARRDPLGPADPANSTYDTTVKYDTPYDLLPISVTDPVGLSTTASYDYRLLQPIEVVDVNQNHTHYAFSPLGLLQSIAVMGKPGEEVGDTPEQPGTRFLYDLLAFEHSPSIAPQPIWVQSIRRTQHRWDFIHEENARRRQQNLPPLTPAEIQALFPPDEVDQFPERFLQTREFSDGFGRLLQTRTQAEDVLFDDPTLAQPVFGDAGLPADQNSPPGDAVGAQASAASPFVAVSGWQVYDNKGQVVEKYEPFFSIGWAYNPPLDWQMGQKATMYYDPRGQIIRTVNPDGSEQRVIYGVPGDLANPDEYAPTPWEAYTYDANDNAGRTHPTTSKSYENHRNTPASIVIDALGRTVRQTERDGFNAATDWYATTSNYDIRGNLLSVTDPLGRLSFRYVYDLANRPWRVEQLDAGTRRSILNAVGNVIEQRDSKGALLLHSHDRMNRQLRLWARDNANGTMTLRERLEYGDGSDPQQPATERRANRQLNRLGRLARHYDEAGQLDFAHYDFKGNLLEKTRWVINDVPLLAVFNQVPPGGTIQPFQVDWQPPTGTTLAQLAGHLLDTSTPYTTTSTYDALNRLTSLTCPLDADGLGKQKVFTPTYNRAGALERVELGGQVYVERIAYNAKGQRILMAYGNGLMTRYAYDRQTFRLLRLRTEGYTTPKALTYHPKGQPLQDLGYTYDLVGNILSIQDRTPGSGVLNHPQAGSISIGYPRLAQLLASGDALLRAFSYDPLYRLLSSSGRECNTIAHQRSWEDYPTCGFDHNKQGTPNQENAPQMTSLYSETYVYDPVGNMLTLTHQNGSTTWTRDSGMGGLTPRQWQQAWQNHLNTIGSWTNPPGNRLTHVEDDSSIAAQTHFYDENGNLVRESTSRNLVWDHSDRLRAYYTQAGNGPPTLYVQYLYDSGGQRVKKLVHPSSGSYDATAYIDGLFEQYRWQELGGKIKQNNHIHIMDNQQRIALLRIGDAPGDDHGPAVQYHLGDHLGSSSLVLDQAGNWVNREEFFPYGETSFGSFAKKRYRFTGKERDEESGLYYHGARYYAPWLAKWVRCDPLLGTDGLNLYTFTKNNPLRFSDPTGSQVDDESPGAATNAQPLDSSAQDINITTDKEITILPSNLTYSQSAAANEKKRLDAKLAERGIDIRPDNAKYWNALIEELTGKSPEDPGWGSADTSSTGQGNLRFFYIKGGYEGFLSKNLKNQNAERVWWGIYRPGTTDLNDALVIFDRKGNLQGVFQLAVPNYDPRTSQMVEQEWNGEPVFSQWNDRYKYHPLSVLDSEKALQLQHPDWHRYWIDIHHESYTFGCIEIASTPFKGVRDVDAFIANLSQRFGKNETMTLINYDERTGRPGIFDVTRRFVGRMFVLDAGK